jgi:hypothetical protein
MLLDLEIQKEIMNDIDEVFNFLDDVDILDHMFFQSRNGLEFSFSVFYLMYKISGQVH